MGTCLCRRGAGRRSLIRPPDLRHGQAELFEVGLDVGTEAGAGGVWCGGGRQWHLVDSYLNTRTEREFRAVLKRGGRIYARSPVISFERQHDRWVVKTGQGEITGRALVVATNAYSGEFAKSLVPAIAQEVMPVLSWQMATQPLSEAVRKTIIPGRQAMSDTHGELYFARYDARNRLVTGGAVIGPGNKADKLKLRVGERLQRLWPQIGQLSFDYVWNGYVGMTTDFLPRIHRLGPGAYGTISSLIDSLSGHLGDAGFKTRKAKCVTQNFSKAHAVGARALLSCADSHSTHSFRTAAIRRRPGLPTPFH